MPLLLRHPIAWLCLFFGLAAMIRGAPAASPDVRFSATLEPSERTACGLNRLTSDQVAVIDALVRRDTERRGLSVQPGSPPADPTFSGRLTPAERAGAGLPGLTSTETTRLDAAIDRHQNARLARTLLAPPTFLSPSRTIVPTERKPGREIHGSFSLSYGFGSGGYREKTGAMTMTLDDPDRGFSVTIGYSETHTKGGVPYYLLRDPLADRAGLPP